MNKSELELLLSKHKLGDRLLVVGEPEVNMMLEIVTLANNHDSKHVKDLAVKQCLQFFTKLIEINACTESS